MKSSLIKYGMLTIGTLLLFYTIIMGITSNFNIGIVALGLFAAGIIAYGSLFNKLKKMKWVHIAVCTLCFSLAAFSGFLFIYGANDNSQYDEDVVIILGSGIRGETVGPNLANRLDKAAEYYHENPNAIFIVSGGQGAQESITEALAMERYLLKKGIPLEQIIKEEKSTSTYENFLLSGELLEEKFPQGYSAVFITNKFHIYRAEKFAKRAGITVNHIGADTVLHTIPMNYMREMLAVAHLWILNRK